MDTISNTANSLYSVTTLPHFTLVRFTQAAGQKNDHFYYTQRPGVLDLGFCLKGSWQIKHSKVSQRASAGCVGTMHCPHDTITSEFTAEMASSSIGVTLDISALQEYLEHPATNNIGLKKILLAEKNESFMNFDSMTSKLHLIAMQIYSANSADPLSNLYMESKILELLHEYFSSKKQVGSKNDVCNSLSKNDIRQLIHAQDVILNHLETPPSIESLSRTVGMSSSKLKQVFKKYYRTTIYSFIKQKRLEYARNKIESGEMNVTEAALSVGYTSFGHFSQIFKTTFGILPKHAARKPIIYFSEANC